MRQREGIAGLALGLLILVAAVAIGVAIATVVGG
jgi:hypothetical protein